MDRLIKYLEGKGVAPEEFYGIPPEERENYIRRIMDNKVPDWREAPGYKGFQTTLNILLDAPQDYYPPPPRWEKGEFKEVIEERDDGLKLWHYDFYMWPDGSVANNVYMWRDAEGHIRSKYGVGEIPEPKV